MLADTERPWVTPIWRIPGRSRDSGAGSARRALLSVQSSTVPWQPTVVSRSRASRIPSSDAHGSRIRVGCLARNESGPRYLCQYHQSRLREGFLLFEGAGV